MMASSQQDSIRRCTPAGQGMNGGHCRGDVQLAR
jgi:hypothetical protein